MSANGSGKERKTYAYSLEVIRSGEGIGLRPSYNLDFENPKNVADVLYFIKRAEKLLTKVLEIQDASEVYENEKEFFDEQFKKLRGDTPDELVSDIEEIEDLFGEYLKEEKT